MLRRAAAKYEAVLMGVHILTVISLGKDKTMTFTLMGGTEMKT